MRGKCPISPWYVPPPNQTAGRRSLLPPKRPPGQHHKLSNLCDSNLYFWRRRGAFWINTKLCTAFFEVGGGGVVLNKYKTWSLYGLLGACKLLFWSRREAFWINTKFITTFFEVWRAFWINTTFGKSVGSFLVVTAFLEWWGGVLNKFKIWLFYGLLCGSNRVY